MIWRAFNVFSSSISCQAISPMPFALSEIGSVGVHGNVVARMAEHTDADHGNGIKHILCPIAVIQQDAGDEANGNHQQCPNA